MTGTDEYLQFLPENIRTEVETWTIELALNFTYMMTREFIPQHYFDMVGTPGAHGGLAAPCYMCDLAHILSVLSAVSRGLSRMLPNFIDPT